MLRTLLLSAFLLADADPLGPALTAEQFEDYTTGRTLTYATEAGVYGIEEYRSGRRVRWAFTDGECAEGFWYPAGEAICFEYEGMEIPQCWTFHHGDRGLTAIFVNDPDAPFYSELGQTTTPLECHGPEVGV